MIALCWPHLSIVGHLDDPRAVQKRRKARGEARRRDDARRRVVGAAALWNKIVRQPGRSFINQPRPRWLGSKRKCPLT